MVKIVDIETKIRDRLSIYGKDLALEISQNLKSKNLKNTDDLFEDLVEENCWNYMPSDSELFFILKDKKFIPYIIESTDECMEAGCTRKMMLEYAYSMFVQDIMMDDLVKIAKILVLNYIRVKLKGNELQEKTVGLLLKTTDKFLKDNNYSFCINDINDVLLDIEGVKING